MSSAQFPEGIVYPEYSHEGVRFALGRSGSVYAYAKGIPVEKICWLTTGDEQTPWIPKHKNFNSLCRQLVRDGDVNHIISRRKADLKKAELLRKAAPELLEALQYAIKQVPELGTVPGIAAAIAKATGESA